jgi:hypothetical protein
VLAASRVNLTRRLISIEGYYILIYAEYWRRTRFKSRDERLLHKTYTSALGRWGAINLSMKYYNYKMDVYCGQEVFLEISRMQYKAEVRIIDNLPIEKFPWALVFVSSRNESGDESRGCGKRRQS